jgi:hypothetical protein
MRSVLIAIVGVPSAALLAAVPLAGQAGAVGPGSRVRITAPALELSKAVGSLLAIRGDTLLLEHRTSTLQPGHGRRAWSTDTTAVPMTTVTRLEVSAGRRSNIDRGVRKGLLIGGAVGLALGVAMAADDEGNDFVCDGAGCVASGVAGGAVWGLLIGLGIGAFSSRDEWRPVLAQPSAPVALIPTPDGRVVLSAVIEF